MKLALLALLGLGVSYLAYRTVAIGRKLPLTTAEARRAAFEHMAPGYRQTYPGKPAHHALRKQFKLRRRAS